MQVRLFKALSALVVVVLTACSSESDDTTGPTPATSARVRVVNASPATASLNLGATVLSTNVANSVSATCTTVPGGTQTLTFQSAATTVATVPTFDYKAGSRYTIVLAGLGGNATGVVINDNATPNPGVALNALRFFNAAPTATGNVYVTLPGDAITGTMATVARDLAPGAGTSSYVFQATASTRVRAFEPGTTVFTGTPRVDFTWLSIAGNVGVVVLGAAGSIPTGLVASPCL